MVRGHFTVVAKTRGRGRGWRRGRGLRRGPGRGVVFFSNFFFVSIFVAILLYCYFRIFGIFPSFMAEISQKNKEHTEATKGTSLFVFKLREFPTKIGVLVGNIR